MTLPLSTSIQTGAVRGECTVCGRPTQHGTELLTSMREETFAHADKFLFTGFCLCARVRATYLASVHASPWGRLSSGTMGAGIRTRHRFTGR